MKVTCNRVGGLLIDFSPYGKMTEETFANIVEFYKKNGRAPDRFADVDNTSNVYCPMTDAEIAAAVHRPVRRETINPFRS